MTNVVVQVCYDATANVQVLANDCELSSAAHRTKVRRHSTHLKVFELEVHFRVGISNANCSVHGLCRWPCSALDFH